MLNLAGVSHLFVVPRLRGSAYVRGLCGAFPALAHSRPGEIQEEALPALRHLVIVDNTGDGASGHGLARELDGVRCAVDFRELLVWREDGAERRAVEAVEGGLQPDEVVNLQFTRCVRRGAAPCA